MQALSLGGICSQGNAPRSITDRASPECFSSFFILRMKVNHSGKAHCTMSTVGARILRFYQALRRGNDDLGCHGSFFASQTD